MDFLRKIYQKLCNKNYISTTILHNMKYLTKEDSFLRSKCMTLLIKSGLKINIKYKIDTIKNMIDINNDGYPLVKYLINNNADEDNNLKPQTIPNI